jgi:hypothetical protein
LLANGANPRIAPIVAKNQLRQRCRLDPATRLTEVRPLPIVELSALLRMGALAHLGANPLVSKT